MRSTAFILLAILCFGAGCQRRVDPLHEGFRRRAMRRYAAITSDKEFGWRYDDHIHPVEPPYDDRPSSASRKEKHSYVAPSYEKFKNPSGELAAVFQPIYFATDSDSVRGKDNIEKVERMADYLRNHPRVLVFLEGHCDQRGSATYNLALGSRRASSLRNLLIERDISPDRLLTITFGKERPIKQGNYEEAWRWNRRVQHKVYQR